MDYFDYNKYSDEMCRAIYHMHVGVWERKCVNHMKGRALNLIH